MDDLRSKYFLLFFVEPSPQSVELIMMIHESVENYSTYYLTFFHTAPIFFLFRKTRVS